MELLNRCATCHLGTKNCERLYEASLEAEGSITQAMERLASWGDVEGAMDGASDMIGEDREASYHVLGKLGCGLSRHQIDENFNALKGQ